MWQSVGLTLLVIVATLVCALLFMLFEEEPEVNMTTAAPPPPPALSVFHLALLCLHTGCKHLSHIIRCWYVVWQLFLSKFKFLRELVGDASTPQAELQPSEIKSERTVNAPTRNRPRTARQRVVSLESNS